MRPELRRLFGAGALALAAGAAVAAEPVPLKDLVRNAEFVSAKISPTGEYLAVAMPVRGQTSVGILNLKTRQVTGSLRWQRGEHVHDYGWVGPDRVVASLARSAGPLDTPAATGELYAINADNSRYVALHEPQRSFFMIDALLNDPGSALVYIVPWLQGKYEPPTILAERVNTRDGKRQRVAVIPGEPPLDVAIDRQGRIRFVFSRGTYSDKYNLHAKTDSGWKEVRHPGGAASLIQLHGTTADGSSVFLTSASEGGPDCLREYRFADGTLTDRLCREAGAVGEPVFSFDADTLIGLVHEAGVPELQLLQPDHPDARLRALLGRTFKGQRVTVTSGTQDGKKLVLLVDSDRNPGDFYLFDRDTKKAEYLMSRRSWIDPERMTPVSAITYKARGGATIHGYLTAARGTESRKLPLVLMPHGGPHGIRDSWVWDPLPQALASRGYAVLQVNFRGSGGYGYAHESAGYRKWGTLMQDDLTDAVRWAIDAGIADPKRICIFGGSYGGYAALMSSVREPDLYRCAIGFAGPYDLVEQVDDSDTGESRFGRRYMQRVLGDDETMRAQSPLTYIGQLKAPVLIAHGTEDKRVPFSQAKLLRKALDKHQKPYEWLEFKGEGHGLYDEANREAFLTRLLEFLDRHIGAGAAAAGAQTQ